MSDANTVKVWDPLVRIGHWLLVAGFVIAYASGDEFPQVHAFAGYLLAVVLGIRIVWGFAGPAHARFRNFVRGPATTLSYLGDVAAHRDRRYLGHNPAGAAMTMALLICRVHRFRALSRYGPTQFPRGGPRDRSRPDRRGNIGGGGQTRRSRARSRIGATGAAIGRERRARGGRKSRSAVDRAACGRGTTCKPRTSREPGPGDGHGPQKAGRR